MSKTKAKTDVATVNQDEEFGLATMPDYIAQGSGRGNEGVSADDMSIPRLEICQSQSPIKDENDEIRDGDLFNSISNQVYGDSVFIVPVFFRLEYLVWKDKKKGGGFFGSFDTEAEAQARIDGLEDENPEELEIVDTPVHYCLRVFGNPIEGYKTEQIVISMAKSKAKISRKWNALVQMAGGDRFSRIYKVGTFKDKNAKNETFYNYTIDMKGFPPENVYREAERVYDLFKSGTARANHQSSGEGFETGIPAGTEI